MFLHIFKYRVIQLFHEKEMIMWVFLFPLILGTMFFASFGNMMDTYSNDFETIPIALVSQSNADTTFEAVLDSLSQDNDDQMFTLTSVSEDEAIKLLEEGKIDGIIYSSETPSITVSNDGINQSIIKTFVEQYLQQKYMLHQILADHPEKFSDAIKLISKDILYNVQGSLTNSKMNPYSQYFYALIAMACLYGSLIGLNTVTNIQANLSPLGARREVSPASKLTVIFGEFFASVFVNYLSLLTLYFYLIIILKIDFGTKIPLILISTLFGSIIGVSCGTFIGSIGKWSEKTKESILIGYSMLCCFLSGLMMNTMKDIVEHSFPIINRLNPAALITDCLYSLDMYDTYDRFLTDISIMGVMALLLCFGSYLFLRRNKYANI